MKKSIKFLVVLFVLAFVTASCSDAMDEIEPIEDEETGLNAGGANSGAY